MSTTYPITARRKLEPAARGRWLRRPTRTPDELLKPDAHHVLVYRVDGQYVLDSDRMLPVDERVIGATYVSMVDVRRNAPVSVVLNIPSADAADFEVVVTFTCTVTDPVAVVRGGIDAREALWSYLKAHHRIFELGLDYPLSKVNDVRRAVGAQITAYVTIKPPTVPGMNVSMANVEVTNPEYLKKLEEQSRSKEAEARLAAQEQENRHRLKAGQVLNDHSIETVQQEHQHRMDDQVHTRGREKSLTDARHQRAMASEQVQFEREQFEENMLTIGENPRRALMAAFVSGRIDASTLSEQLRQLDEKDRAAELHELTLEREERRLEREEHQLELAAKREEKQVKREERHRTDEQRRADQQRLADQAREDRLRREEQDRQDERERFQWRIKLLQQAAEKGHFDMVNLHADRLYAEVVGLSPLDGEATQRSLPEGETPVAELESEDSRAQVREDDD